MEGAVNSARRRSAPIRPASCSGTLLMKSTSPASSAATRAGSFGMGVSTACSHGTRPPHHSSFRRSTSGALVDQEPSLKGPVPIAAWPLLNSGLPSPATDFGTMKICVRLVGRIGRGPLVRMRKVKASTTSTPVTPER
jgi:hypothetical protein